MFKTKISSLILGLTLVTTFSCEKDKFENLNNSENQTSAKKGHTSNADVSLMEAFIQNKEDFNMDICLYDATKALLKVIADKSHEQVIYKLAAQKNFEPVSFSEIVAVEPQILVVIDNYLNTSALGTYKNLKTLTNKMTYEKVDYFPQVTVSRLNAANATEPSLVAAGIEITENDEIMSWSGADGYAQVVPLSQTMAETSQVPVLIVTNGTNYVIDADKESKKMHVHEDAAQDKHAFDRGFSMSQYRINNGYRYEGGTSKTELVFTRTLHGDTPFLSTTEVFSPSYIKSPYIDSYGKVADISPSDVNSSTNFTPVPDVTFQHTDPTFTNPFNILWMTSFEYDWYAGGKTVSIHGNTLKHNVLMKYASEWYFLVPELPFNSFTVGVGGAQIYSNAKCRFVIYRNA